MTEAPLMTKELVAKLKPLIKFSNNLPGTKTPHFHITEEAGECKGGDVIAEVIAALEAAKLPASDDYYELDSDGFEHFKASIKVTNIEPGPGSSGVEGFITIKPLTRVAKRPRGRYEIKWLEAKSPEEE